MEENEKEDEDDSTRAATKAWTKVHGRVPTPDDKVTK
jgi:hypothetical protein